MNKTEEKILAYDIFGNPIYNLDYIITNKNNQLNAYRVMGETGKNDSLLKCYKVYKEKTGYEKDNYSVITCNMISIPKNSEIILLNIDMNKQTYNEENNNSNDSMDINNMPRA